MYSDAFTSLQHAHTMIIKSLALIKIVIGHPVSTKQSSQTKGKVHLVILHDKALALK